jgi:hypothetical protein
MPKIRSRTPFAEVIGKTLAGIRLIPDNVPGNRSLEVHFTDGTFVSIELEPMMRVTSTLMKTADNGDYEVLRNYGPLKVDD